MGQYNVKSKQNLSGIATLTNNPIAVDNIRSVARRSKEELDAEKLRIFRESMAIEIPDTCKNPKLLHIPEWQKGEFP